MRLSSGISLKILLSAVSLVLSTSLWGAVQVGKPAPTFAEKDQNGKLHKLEDFKGKWVVLEWFNEGCPYVKKHYESGNMQALQDKYGKRDVVWLTVATSAKGKQGYVAPDKAQDQVKRAKMKAAALLLDADGTMGKAYGAKTTPHMYVISPAGKIAYVGAIDSNDSANPATIAGAENYVASALEAALAGKPIKTSSTKPYGCSVKYK